LHQRGGGGGRAAGGQQVVQQQHAGAGLERVGVDGDGGVAVFQRVFLLDGLEGQLAFLRTGTKPAFNFWAAAAAKMKPRASMPTTASMLPGGKFFGEQVNRAGEQPRVGEHGRDVLELDARLGENRRRCGWRLQFQRR
jgi:hypothetical protein